MQIHFCVLTSGKPQEFKIFYYFRPVFTLIAFMKSIPTGKGNIAVFDEENLLIRDGSDLISAFYSGGCDTAAFRKEHFPPEFWDLSTRLAGEMLQKVSNYRSRMIILGDFSHIDSKSLRDFIFESNRHGTVVFAADLEEALRLLR